MKSYANKYLSIMLFLVKAKQLDLFVSFGLSWLSVRSIHMKYMVQVFYLQTEWIGFSFYNLCSVCCNQSCSKQETCGSKYVFEIVAVTVCQVLCIKYCVFFGLFVVLQECRCHVLVSQLSSIYLCLKKDSTYMLFSCGKV